MMDSWQSRLKEEKEKDRQRHKESAEHLQNYRGSDFEENKLKAMKEEDRRKRIEAEDILHAFQSTEDATLLHSRKSPLRKTSEQQHYPEPVNRSTPNSKRASEIAAGAVSALASELEARHSPCKAVAPPFHHSTTQTTVENETDHINESFYETQQQPPLADDDDDDEEPDFVQTLSDRDEVQQGLDEFVAQHAIHHRPLAVVTSGGTAADMECNSVRCLENFSTGQRGAVAVEEFLKRGYAVVHLQRTGSAAPYARALSEYLGLPAANQSLSVESLGRLFAIRGENQDDDLVQTVVQDDPWLSEAATEDAIPVSSNGHKKHQDELSLHRGLAYSTQIQRMLRERSSALAEGRLLTIRFRSVEEYLGKLELCGTAVRECNSLALFFLAAAVSDFYVPRNERSEHKLQSGDGTLVLRLSPVPKRMGWIRTKWASQSFVVAFKLETDHNLLRQKAERAVERYGCQMVIGNLLHNRHEQVSIFMPPDYQNVTRDTRNWSFETISRHASAQDTLESVIIDTVVQAHFEFISWNYQKEIGVRVAQKSHALLREKKQKIQRDAFWKRVKGVGLEVAGGVIALIISYSINAALQRRLHR